MFYDERINCVNSNLDWINGMTVKEILDSHDEWSRRSGRVPLKCRTIKEAFLFDGYCKKFTFWTFLHFLFPIFTERNEVICFRIQQLYCFKRLRHLERRKSGSIFMRFSFSIFFYLRLAFLIAVYNYLKSYMQEHFNTRLSSFADVGQGLVVSGNSSLRITALVRIGKKVLIGPNSSILAHCGWPVIGDNVTLWTNSIVVGNVKVGDHAIIGANAVVTKDIPAYATAVGIPAKVIKVSEKSPEENLNDHSL